MKAVPATLFYSLAMCATLLLAREPASAQAPAEPAPAFTPINASIPSDVLTVAVDQATVVRLPEKVATMIIGNPLIADVSLQAGGTVVITGKGYGATNVMALDRQGTILMEKLVRVEGPRDNVVVVYRGVERETYSCQPRCERRITLGDGPEYFNSTIGQAGARSGQAQGAQQQQQSR